MSSLKRIIPVFIPHLGCRHECVFCNQRQISGANQAPKIKDVSKIAQDACKLSPPIELAFYGGSFTALCPDLQNSFLEAARPLLAFDARNEIRVSTRPDFIDAPTVIRLKSCGVSTIELGAQSMCDDVLISANRGHSSLDVINAARIIKASGLKLVLQMMTGLPGDSYEKSIETGMKISELMPDAVRIYPAVIVKGTALYEMWRSDLYKEHTVEDAVDLCAELCLIFDKHKIPIIRLGLNPTDDLSGGLAVGGAYHPAFGELVYSRICLNMAKSLLAGAVPGSEALITVSKGFTSKMIGNKRSNIHALKDMFSLREIKVSELNKYSISRIVPEMAVSFAGQTDFAVF